MRTKALVCAAAIAAGAVTAMAQSNVYSLNVVGYVNLTLPSGFSLVANALDLDQTGTNNTTVTVFGTSLPVNSQVFTWNGTGYNLSSYLRNKAGTATNWSPVNKLDPGMGAWVGIPAGAGPVTATIVGNVLQGGLVNPNIPAGGGFGLVASMAPVQGLLQTALNYQPNVNDQVYQWNGTGYNLNSYLRNKAGTATNWGPAQPTIGVGEGFWLNSVKAGTVWSNYFVVQ